MTSTSLLRTQLSLATGAAPAYLRTSRPTLCSEFQGVRLAGVFNTSPTRRSLGRALIMTRADGQPPSFTQVPKAKTDEEAITGALALAHDCQAAYSQAAKKASDPELKKALDKFASQADGWIDQWRGLLNPPPEKETGISTALNAGKVKFAQIAGDKAIVKAIFNNSNDSFTAFNEVSKRSDFSSSTTSVAKKLAPQAEEARTFFEKWESAQS